MSDIIDLDALQPKPVIIKFNGQEITLNPPKTGDILKLGESAAKLQTISDKTPAEINTLIEEVTSAVYIIVPELTGQALNSQQLLALIKAISEMAIPPDAKELAQRGITVDGDPKAG